MDCGLTCCASAAAEAHCEKCQNSSDLARRRRSAASACWTATRGAGLWVEILGRVIVCLSLLDGFGFDLAPIIIVGNATADPNLVARFVQNRLKAPRVG